MNGIGRRDFLRLSMWGAATLCVTPAVLRSQNLGNKLNIGIIGAGGRGSENTSKTSGENILALCDVVEDRLNQAGTKYPKARKYVDFRKLLDDAKDLDAIVVSTAEHTHAFATFWALKLGKHVYCEKPLTHSIEEARLVAKAAAEAKVATQMGTQIHATENYRRIVELVQAGAIGPVREAHVWTSRAWGWQSKADSDANKDIVFVQERPKESSPVPAGLHWDLFLGPAPERPFNTVYWPGPKWYRWWDFGSGTMSDLGSHFIDLPFWALKLRHPLTIESEGPPPHPEIAPASMVARYEYGARGEMPPVKVAWYQGSYKPPQYENKTIPQWGSGILFVGDKGMLLCDYGKHVLLPEDKFKDYQRPAPSIPPSPGHQEEWIACCKSGKQASCHFDYAEFGN